MAWISRSRLVDIGKRSGVTSGILGALCVLAELCFLFPDMLVYAEARHFYIAQIGVFRAVLFTAIVVTLALGAASVLILRSRTHGVIGMALGMIAVLLGGPDARAVTDQPRAFTAGLDYFILSLLVLGLIFVPMERLWTLREQKIFRTGWQTDLAHFFTNHVGVQLTAFATMIPVQLFFGWMVQNRFQQAVAAQPVWIQFFEILLIVDLVSYWVHRAFHRVPLLWRFHAIHHSVQQMDWLAGSRLHIIDVVVTRLFGFLPVFLCGFSPSAVYAYLVFVSFHAVYIHANVTHRWPVVRRVFTTPEFHHWHHAAEDEAIDKNFAVILSMLDSLFGTSYLPGHWPSRYGVAGEQPPQTWGGQLLYPFQKS